MGIAFIDGEYVPLSEARIPILDRGFVRSDATYDVVHVWNGSFFRLEDHLQRFSASMAGLRMSLEYDAGEIAEILTECVRRSGLRNAYVQMTCTRGIPPVGTRDPRLCRNRFYAFAQPFVWIADEDQRRNGLRMVVSKVRRIPSGSVDPRIKNFHWLDLTMGIFEAYDRDATVPVLVDEHGNLTEGPGFNIFILKDGVLATPDRGVFEGMTRRTVMEIAEQIRLPCKLRSVSSDEADKAREIFITSTAGGIMPVSNLNGKPVGSGTVGPITEQIARLYWDRHAEHWSKPIEYGGVS